MAKTTSARDLKNEINLLHQIIEIIGQSNNPGLMLQQIARVLAEHFKGDSCFIYLLDKKSSVLTLLGAWPPHPAQVGKLRIDSGEGINGWVASHKKPVMLAKNASLDPRLKLFVNLPEDKYSAFLSVPILMGGEPIGVINLMNRKHRAFTQNHVKLLTSIASQLSGAIEKAQVSQLLERKAKQLETIGHLSRTIVSTAYLHEILQLIVTMTAQTMNSKICSLMLLNEQGGELSIAATQSLSEEYRKKPPLKVGQSISGRALQEKQPIAVSDVTREPGYGYPEIARREGLCSMLAVPMLIKNKPIGVINCYTTAEHTFSDEEIHILQTIANQAAVAIENTRLLEESRTTKEALETRKIVERSKGMLMKTRSMSEEEAFQFIQRQAMNLRRTMREVAEAILLSDGLKNK